MTKPAFIQALEQRFSLDFALDDTTDAAIFSRYGRRGVDACRYWLRDGAIVGLCARASGIDRLDWLDDPALEKLEVLLLGENNFAEIKIPAGWSNFERLDLNASPELTSVSFMGEPVGLTRLEITDCPGLSELEIPDDCPQLHYFDVNRSGLVSLELAGDFSSLVYLDASSNPGLQQVSIAGNFASLLSLHLRAAAQLETLKINTTLPALDTLDLAKCPRLSALPQTTVMDSPLERLYLQGTAPKDCPGAFLEKDTNALESVRGWITELRRKPTGNQANKTIKLQVTGNGNVGKSTLLCALGEAELRCTNKDLDRTHGVEIDQLNWEKEDIILNYWDFGGQEIYRGTHRLFAAERALHLLVFDPETERKAVAGLRGDNRTGGEEGKQVIQYFYDTIREGSGNCVTVLQNKRDESPREDTHIAEWAESEQLGFRHIDALSGTGLKRLKQQLIDDIDRLPGYEMLFPAGWLAVRDWFIDNLEAEVIQRVLDWDTFVGICRENSIGEGYEELLLDYLAAAGYCYRHQLLKGKIIADQRWALTGIYQLFDPKDIAEKLSRKEGEVAVEELFSYFDKTEVYNYSEDEKWLLLDFLESCGLCFSITPEKEERQHERSLNDFYILPEYLPLAEDPREADYWHDQVGRATVLRKKVPYLDYPKFHAFLCRIGRKTTKPRLWYGGVDVLTDDGERFLVRLVPGEEPYYEIMLKAGSEDWLRVLKEESSLGKEGWEVLAGNIDERTGQQGTELKEAKKLNDLPNKRFPEGYKSLHFLYANPPETSRIGCKKELDTLREFRDKHPELPFYDCVVQGDLSYRKLTKSLASPKRPRLVHFAGHGVDNAKDWVNRGLVVYENDLSSTKVLNAKRLGDLFAEAKQHHNPDLEVVVLNACVSEEQAIAISRAGIYVVGTTVLIGDEAAIEFALAFYRECALLNYSYTKENLCAAMNMGVLATIGDYGKRAEEVYQMFYKGETVNFR